MREDGYRVRIDGGKWWDPPGDHFDERGYDEPVGNEVTSRYFRQDIFYTLDFIRRMSASSTPFVLVSMPSVPHLPHDPPQEQRDRFPLSSIPVPTWSNNPSQYRQREQDYLAMTAWYDQHVMTIIGALRVNNVLENTIVIFVSDNGWATGRAAKSSPYAAGNRSPLIIFGPGFAVATSNEFIQLMDLAPTILKRCGLPPLPNAEGMDFLDSSYAPPGIVFGFTQRAEPLAVWSQRTDGIRFIHWLRAVEQDDRHRFLEYTNTAFAPARLKGEEELYDIVADVDEQADLIADPAHTQDVSILRAATEQWWGETLTPRPPKTTDIIDDGDSRFSTSGNWVHNTNPFRPAFGGDIHYSAAGNGADQAVWGFSALAPGQYQVYVTWNGTTNRATNSPFTITADSSPPIAVLVNQESEPHCDHTVANRPFQKLGSAVTVGAGSIVIRLTDDADEFVIADAVLIVKED